MQRLQIYLRLKVRSGDVWPLVRDWSKPPAVNLHSCRDIWEGGDWTTTSYCDVCLFFITAPSSLFPRHLIRPDYRVTLYGGVWHTQPTLDIDPVRSTTVCDVTAVERGTSCGIFTKVHSP